MEKLGANAPSEKLTASGLTGAVMILARLGAEVFGVEIPIDDVALSGLVWAAMTVAFWLKAEGRPSPSAIEEVGRRLQELVDAQHDAPGLHGN